MRLPAGKSRLQVFFVGGDTNKSINNSCLLLSQSKCKTLFH